MFVPFASAYWTYLRVSLGQVVLTSSVERMSPMVLSFTLNEADCVALMEDYVGHSPVHQRSRMRVRWYFPVMLIASLVFLTAKDGQSFLLGAIFGGLVGLLWWLFSLKAYDAMIRSHVRKQMQESGYSKNFGPHVVEVTDDRIISSGPSGKSEYALESVERIDLTPKYLFIFFSGLAGLPIPVHQVGAESSRAAYELLVAKTKVFA